MRCGVCVRSAPALWCNGCYAVCSAFIIEIFFYIFISIIMFTVLGIMFLGVGAGYLLRNVRFVSKIGGVISVTIYLLLLSLGLSIGSNDNIVKNLPVFGGQAFVLAMASMVGSVLAGWLVYKYVFKKGGRS